MLLEHRQQGRSDEDRRIGPAREPDQQREAEVFESDRSKDLDPDNEHRQYGENGDERSVDGPGERLVHRQVHDVGVRELSCRAEPARIISHSVEHDDGVVERITEHGQKRYDGVRGDQERRKGIDPDGDDDVVRDRDDRRQRHLPLEEQRDVSRDHEQKDDQRFNRLVGDVAPPRRSDTVDRHR